jgi:lipoprotein-anchoring transpeptidase ErfK/SrfK
MRIWSAVVGVVVVVGSLLVVAPSQASVIETEASRPVPKNSGEGRRVVLRLSVPQHVWLVAKSGEVVRDFPVSGRTDWPLPGTYAVFSKSPQSWNATYGVRFRYMVRFTMGRSAAIGFHTIPRLISTGERVHSPDDLGQALGTGGCPHLKQSDAEFLYSWARMGTPVIALR